MNPLVARSWWLMTALVVALAGPSLAGGSNLLVNPGFEASGGSYDGWTTFGSGPQISTPDTDNIARSGIAAAKIFGEFTGCPDFPSFDVGGVFQTFTPNVGSTYEFSGFAFVSSADPIPGTGTCDFNRLIAKIVYRDGGGAEIASNEIVVGDHATPLDQWIKFSVRAPAPAAAAAVETFFLFLQPSCDTGAVFVDDTSFCELPVSVIPVEPNILTNPSFDLDLSGWSTFGNAVHEFRSFGLHTPGGSAKLFSTFVPDQDTGMFQNFAASPGSDWKLDVYSMTTCVEDPITDDNDNVGLAIIVFRNGSGDEIGSVVSTIIDNTAPLGTWVQHTVIAYNAPAGTASVDALILFSSPSLLNGAMFIDDVGFQQLDVIGIADQQTSAGRLTLDQNAPNPFNPSTTIGFELTASELVSLRIYDVAGRWVTTLVDDELTAGRHRIVWDGKAANGSAVAGGVYRYVLETSSGARSRSMVLIK